MNHALIFSVRPNFTERGSGAHRIATILRKDGMDVEVVDFAAHWEFELLKEFTKKSVTPNTLFFGFSIFGYWNKLIADFSFWLKSEYPNIKIIAGGQDVLSVTESSIDIWIDSYGEEAILAVVKSLAGNTPNNLNFSVEHFGKRKVIKALHSYPSYNLGDYSNLLEARDFLEPYEWLTIEFARGCKFKCAFCNFPILGVKEDTSRTKESVEYELKYNYDNFGIDRYYVADETFNDRVEKISKFADVVDSLDFNPFFGGFIRADLLYVPGMIEELARMRFGGQYYGIETFNKKSGVTVGKGLDPEKVKRILQSTKEYFNLSDTPYRGEISLIAGLPFETPATLKDSIAWLTENWSSEAAQMFLLELHDPNLSNRTNLSKMSLNLEKYGIRSLGPRSRNPKSDSYDNIIWDHDTMTYAEAMDISYNFELISRDIFKVGIWSLGYAEFMQEKKLDINDLLSIEKEYTWRERDKFRNSNSFVKSYSLKKLNK